jgi:Uma2 family endonuclease
MPTLVMDPKLSAELLEKRRAWGADKFDEVWDGVYVMSPLPNNEHQELLVKLSSAFVNVFSSRPEIRVFPGINVSDRREGWEHNFRCPDVAVVLPDSRAIDCGTFFCGGPDFAVEVISEYDRSREKFDFYASVGVRELLLVDRDPWQLELYRLVGTELVAAGLVGCASSAPLSSEILGLTFRLLPRASQRPIIEILQPATGLQWLA